MTTLTNKTVFITGASSGIGLACAEAFAKQGARLLLCARRVDRLRENAELLMEEYGIDVYAFELDVREQQRVDQAINALPDEWKDIDVLVNNAGLSRGLDKFQDANIGDWEEMIDTNVKGLLYVTKAVLPGMLARNAGHIVNIGSIAGHEVYPKGHVYCASKHAVDAITQGLRLDLVDTPLRVTTIDPGMVETEFSIVRFHGDEVRAASVYKGIQPLTAMDVAETVVWSCSRPPHVQVAEIILLPTSQASAQVVHRN